MKSILLATLFCAAAVAAQPTAISAGQIKCPVPAIANGLIQIPATIGVSFSTQFGVFVLLGCVALDSSQFTITAATQTAPITLHVNSGNTGPTFVGPVVPSGTQDGVNLVFNLPDAPNPSTSLECIRNGLMLTAVIGTALPVDFSLGTGTSANVMTFVSTATVPQPGDTFSCRYRK